MTASGALADRLRAVAAERHLNYSANHEPSMWLRMRLADLNARITSGQIARCAHLRRGDITTVALWSPDRVVCTVCAPSLRLTGDADRTCDRCSTVVTPIHPEVVAIAQLAVVFGLCTACHEREHGRGCGR